MSNSVVNECSRSRRVGDVVQFREAKAYGGRVAAAIITAVHSPSCFNVYVLPGDSGQPYTATSVNVGNNGYYIED